MSKTALITGGSSGIGLAISRKFASAGYRLLWVALSEAELNAGRKKLLSDFPDVNLEMLELDLSQDGAPEKVYEWTTNNNWPISVLVNNAGFGNYGFIKDIDRQRAQSMIRLNILALYNLTRLYLDEMAAANHGTIINISSNSSFQPTPRLSTYGSTKAFVTHFTRSLSEEMKALGSKVKVICVCPAAISDTAFRKVNDMDNVQTFDGLATTTAEEVAKDVWNGFNAGKDFIISGWKMRLVRRITFLIPYPVQQFLIRRELNEMKG